MEGSGRQRGPLVFLDDAGDPGFKFAHGSSSHFVIAAVTFVDRLAAEAVAKTMQGYRRQQGWQPQHEFKFNKLEKRHAKTVLTLLAEIDFSITAGRVDKSLIRSGELRNRPESLYRYVIMKTLDRIPGLHDADVRLDAHGGRGFKRSASVYLRQQLNAQARKVARFRFVDSSTNDLIQLADLTAGSILRAVQDKTDASDYVDILKPRINEIWDMK